MNRLLAVIALPFILGLNLLTITWKKKKDKEAEVPMDLLSHTFKMEEKIEAQAPFMIREPKFLDEA